MTSEETKKYRKKTTKNAARNLELAFEKAKGKITFLEKGNVLDIICPGAGHFPSMLPFVQQLMILNPDVININFTLIDIIPENRDTFSSVSKEDIETIGKNYPRLKINFLYSVSDIKVAFSKFAKEGKKFDLVYFEHPEVFQIGILLNMRGTLRESFSILPMILKKSSVVIVTSFTCVEMTDASHLLEYTIDYKKSTAWSRSCFYFYGEYAKIKFFQPDADRLQNTNLEATEKSASVIYWQDQYFQLCLSASIVIWLMEMSKGAATRSSLIHDGSFIIGMGQILGHGYTRPRTLFKSVLFFAQIALLFCVSDPQTQMENPNFGPKP